MISAVTRLSWPTPIRSACPRFPVFCSRYSAKEAAIFSTISGVSVTGSFSVAMAAPRTSFPFCTLMNRSCMSSLISVLLPRKNAKFSFYHTAFPGKMVVQIPRYPKCRADGQARASHPARCAHLTALTLDERWPSNGRPCKHSARSPALSRNKKRRGCEKSIA